MDSLDNHALQQVLQHLDWRDLMAAGSSCRRLRAAAAADSFVWQHLCHSRWRGPLNTWRADPPQPTSSSTSSAATAPQPPAIDYRALFLQDNGWADPSASLAMQRWAGSSWNDEVVAAQPCAAADGSTLVALSSSQELRLLRVDASPIDALEPLRAGKHIRDGANVQWASLAALPGSDGGLVAAGSCHGSITLWRLPAWRSAAPAQAEAEQLATLPFPGNNSLVGELHYLPNCRQLAALLDPLSLLRHGAQQGSQLSIADADTWQEARPHMRDVLDGYELAAAVPVDTGSGGCEFIAGSVKLSDDQASGWACRRCYAAAPAATCYHKSPAASAGLCFFDSRAQRGLVARYATHHRSLYPHLELVREHFLLTSHSGTPVAVWDRRRMNGPVHEVQHIPRELEPQLGASLLLEDPGEHDPPTSQALHLSGTADFLVGRADSGMCWLFDLSERLGWADGSRMGTWLRTHQGLAQPGQQAAAGMAGGEQPARAAADMAPRADGDCEMAEGREAADEVHLDEWDYDRAPLPLGCIGAPFEVWCSNGGEAPPLHWLPRAAAWLSHNHQLLTLGGLELDDKQRLFPAYAQGSPYPSNALVVASLQRRQ